MTTTKKKHPTSSHPSRRSPQGNHLGQPWQEKRNPLQHRPKSQLHGRRRELERLPPLLTLGVTENCSTSRTGLRPPRPTSYRSQRRIQHRSWGLRMSPLGKTAEGRERNAPTDCLPEVDFHELLQQRRQIAIVWIEMRTIAGFTVRTVLLHGFRQQVP